MEDKKTVGFLVSGIMDEFTEQLCRGIIDEASSDNVNLVVIPVKYINREMKDIPDLYEYQYETNIHNISASNLDVLIVAADCIGCLTTAENLNNFMQELNSKNVPIILAASKMDNYPGVIFDNTAGIVEGMKYLIEVLNIKNICMLSSVGPNADVAERQSAFLNMMDIYELEVGPDSIITTNLTSDCYEEAEKLLDLNPDVEAVFCVNDEVALGLYNVMKNRGLTPGKEIKVMGFDNSASAGIITPSLTTVEADAVHLGHRVFTMVRMLLEGWDVGNMTIPTRFILRDSFGSLLDKENVDEKILDKQNVDIYFNRIFFKYENAPDKDKMEILIMFKTIMNIIIDYIGDIEYNPQRVAFISTKVDEFFKAGALKYTDPDVLMAYVERVKIAALNRFDSYQRKCQAYETFAVIAEKILKNVGLIARTDDYDTIKDESLFSLKTLVENTLSKLPIDAADPIMAPLSEMEIYKSIAANLKMFGVQNAYIYLFENPIVHKQGQPFYAPDRMLLKVAMTDGEISGIPENSQEISIDNIYNNEFINPEKNNMVMMPLYFHDIVYGNILYDLTDISFKSGEFLANQYSLVVRMINLFHK